MGHIKIDRKILEWEWYSDINTCRLFMHMLLKVNWKDGRFQGITVPRGSMVTSYQTLAAETGLSVRNVRTALEHLKSTGEVTVNRQAKFSVVTIKNYCQYQSGDTVTDNQVTVNRQTTDSQLTTIEEEKEVKKKKENILCEANELFERLWKLYPCKKGKGQVSDTQKKRLLAVGETALVKAIERYSSELQKDAGWRKPQNGSTFFNSGYVDYLDENFAPDKQAASKPQNTKNRFNNFQQRQYDYSSLEAQLLGER